MIRWPNVEMFPRAPGVGPIMMTRESVDKLFDTIGPRLATARAAISHHRGGSARDGGEIAFPSAGQRKVRRSEAEKEREVRSKRVEAAKKAMDESQAN